MPTLARSNEIGDNSHKIIEMRSEEADSLTFERGKMDISKNQSQSNKREDYTMARKDNEMYTCPRCDGKGHLKEYGHIENGRCFKCRGTGKVNRKPSKSKRQRNPEIEKENLRKQKLAIEMYKDDQRIGVEKDHPCFYMHAIGLAKKDGIWDSL
jgi:RecJ-like exonuclease